MISLTNESCGGLKSDGAQAGRMAPSNKGSEESRSAIDKVVTREYTTNTHKCIHEVGLEKQVPWELKRYAEICQGDVNSRCAF